MSFTLLVITAALLLFTIRELRRVLRANAELERREQARIAADTKARQRDTVHQMVADFTEDCCVEALRHRRGISRDETSNLFALVLCIALGAFGAEVLTWT